MKKEEENNDLGFDLKETLEVARETTKVIGEKIQKLNEPGARMFALHKALLPILLIFGATVEMNGEDPVPTFLDLIKEDYQTSKDLLAVKKLFEESGLN